LCQIVNDPGEYAVFANKPKMPPNFPENLLQLIIGACDSNINSHLSLFGHYFSGKMKRFDSGLPGGVTAKQNVAVYDWNIFDTAGYCLRSA
jgi:hypothetical protein